MQKFEYLSVQVLSLYSCNFIKLFGAASMIAIVIMQRICATVVVLHLKAT